jgi:hypothetical protein
LLSTMGPAPVLWLTPVLRRADAIACGGEQAPSVIDVTREDGLVELQCNRPGLALGDEARRSPGSVQDAPH